MNENTEAIEMLENAVKWLKDEEITETSSGFNCDAMRLAIEALNKAN